MPYLPATDMLCDDLIQQPFTLFCEDESSVEAASGNVGKGAAADGDWRLRM
jgi:hypothetical protein